MIFINQSELRTFLVCHKYLVKDIGSMLHVKYKTKSTIYIPRYKWYFLPMLKLRLYIYQDGLALPFLMAWHSMNLFIASNRTSKKH